AQGVYSLVGGLALLAMRTGKFVDPAGLLSYLLDRSGDDDDPGAKAPPGRVAAGALQFFVRAGSSAESSFEFKVERNNAHSISRTVPDVTVGGTRARRGAGVGRQACHHCRCGDRQAAPAADRKAPARTAF